MEPLHYIHHTNGSSKYSGQISAMVQYPSGRRNPNPRDKVDPSLPDHKSFRLHYSAAHDIPAELYPNRSLA